MPRTDNHKGRVPTQHVHIFDPEEGHAVMTVKISKPYRIALEKLCRMLGEPLSAIVRRLVREELYFRGLIDDELL